MTYTQLRRQRLGNQGLCIDCGISPRFGGYMRCEACGEYAAEQQAARNRQRRYLVIATAQRGSLKKAEPLPAAENALVNARVEQEAAWARMERDPSLSKWPDAWTNREYKQREGRR
jgi:hypothetical protein